MRNWRWTVVLAAVVVTWACGGTPEPGGQQGQQAQTKNVGNVYFLSSQGQPAQEVEAMNSKVLAKFNGKVEFNSQLVGAQMLDKLTSEYKGGKVSVDAVAMLHGDFATLQKEDLLEDLTPLMQRLQKDRKFPKQLVDYGKLGAQKQLYVPWLQATYLMVTNKKALQYLPKGADINNLTYDQLVEWGQNIQKGTGERKIGLPVAPGVRGGLINRFLQGYAYPSYTGTTIGGFKSAEAVQMWQMLRRLWAVSHPQSPTYANMQEPLQSGEVWVAWDHQARLVDALKNFGDQFQTFPAPSGPKGLGFMSVLAGIGIPKGSPNKAGAEALIDYLTRSEQQTSAGTAISFFPVLEGVKIEGAGAPPHLVAEGTVAAKYVANKKAVAAVTPVGLGAKGDEFTLAYQDTFTRILLRNEDIQTVLNEKAAQLQQILATTKAPCWPPDPPSSGPCQIK